MSAASAARDLDEPRDVRGLGVPERMITDITLRRALLDGETSTLQLADHLAVSPVLLDGVVEELIHQRLFEVQGREGFNYFVTLTDSGHSQAMQRMDVCRYAGVVPVALADYSAQVHAQHRLPEINATVMRRALDDLVISDALLDDLGPAVRSPGAMFLYGLPGTGKSAIAERLVRVHDDTVLVPHAVEVDGQIVTVFDPLVHHPVETQPDRLDRRWVLCRRPSVIVGGELTASQLDLTFDQTSGTYQAPPQLLANNGILVIDDFGRQQLTPERLLNRWIVALDRGRDHLSLDYGVKFEVPFLLKIVFCTNLRPSSLADEAFYRRMHSKVLVPPIDDDQFDEVLERVSEQTGVSVVAGASAHLRKASREIGDGDLRPYLPGAVCELVVSIAGYEGRPPVLDPDMVDRVVALYFTHDRAMHGDTLPRLAAGEPLTGLPTGVGFVDAEAVAS